MQITIATNERGQPVRLDLADLLAQRLLIQGASGSGKSYFLRRVVEQTLSAGLPITLVDIEGEFSTLAQRWPISIIDALTLSDTRQPYALAESAARYKQSIVIDCSTLTSEQRQPLIGAYLFSVMQLPQSHWLPRLLVIDETHALAPQTGNPETRALLADIASRGRKRGLALIAATQRLSKLHKDVAAELRNVLIGQTTIDADVRKACETLAVRADVGNRSRIKRLHYEFLAFGPAFPIANATDLPTLKSLPPLTAPPTQPTFKITDSDPSAVPHTVAHIAASGFLGSPKLVAVQRVTTTTDSLLAAYRWIADHTDATTLADPKLIPRLLAAISTALWSDSHKLLKNTHQNAQNASIRVVWTDPPRYAYNRTDSPETELESVLTGHPTYRYLTNKIEPRT